VTDDAVLSNENFPLPTVEALRHLGHDVLTTAESGRAGQAIPDADVLAFAVAEQRIVVTLNRRHFIRLHHTTPTRAGIVVCTFDPDFVALAQRIHTTLEAQPQMAGQ
jgi:predicted nuclease of predicted toxin-antitoxin system